MPVNRNALIRYKTIDNCLRNKYKRWTLEDLIEACSDALYEYEGIDKGISKRTVQMDIQMMRSEKLGYNAPIVVYENKFYKYENDDYSITNTPLSEQDLKTMSEAVEVLRQFKGFSYFENMDDIVSRLEDHVSSVRRNTVHVIDFEKNENLKGLDFLDTLYNAILNKRVLEIDYRSFVSRSAHLFIFYPYLLKEYRNRWYVFGAICGKHGLYNLALDRINEVKINEKKRYLENDLFDPHTFFDDVIGVTKGLNQIAEKIGFRANKSQAPYIRTKPLHKSQQIIEELKDGSIVFEIKVIINRELLREILGFADGLRILYPQSLVDIIAGKFRAANEIYKDIL